jgi:hypothetical protein
VEASGSGEMGLIMLDFLWNSMMNGKGYAELAKPMYDQKMWAGDIFGIMAPPSLRDVVSLATSIAGKLVPGLEYIDDLLFAGLDLTQGYKTPGEVAQALGVQAIAAVTTFGTSNDLFGGIGGTIDSLGAVGNFFGTALSEAGKKYAAETFKGLISNLFKGEGWDSFAVFADKDIITNSIVTGFINAIDQTLNLQANDHDLSTALKKAGASVTKSYVGSVITGYMNGNGNESWYSNDTISSMLKAGATTLANEITDNINEKIGSSKDGWDGETLAKAALKTGVAATSSYLKSVTSNIIDAVDYNHIGSDNWINMNTISTIWYDDAIIANALSSGVSAGIGEITTSLYRTNDKNYAEENSTKILLNSLVSLTGTYINNASSGIFDAITYSTGEIKIDDIQNSLTGAGTIARTISAGIRMGVETAWVNEWGTEGHIAGKNLVAGLAVAAANYAVHAAYVYSETGDIAKAMQVSLANMDGVNIGIPYGDVYPKLAEIPILAWTHILVNWGSNTAMALVKGIGFKDTSFDFGNDIRKIEEGAGYHLGIDGAPGYYIDQKSSINVFTGILDLWDMQKEKTKKQ